MTQIDRLVSLGTVVVDVVTPVERMPEPGGDVLASGATLAVGGGFNAMAAAVRQGLPTVHAGTVGTGPFGRMARAALTDEGIASDITPLAGLDTGFVVAIVDADGERTFITAIGAEAQLTPELLADVDIRATDALLISGYGLLHADNRRAILNRLARLDPATTVFYDPGPLGHELPDGVRGALASRVDWFSGNAVEIERATGCADPHEGAAALTAALGRGRAVVRIGLGGCIVTNRAGVPTVVEGFPTDPVDTNGAGDAHLGAFIAALAAGMSAERAARRANAAAAFAVGRRGPAESPSRAELDTFLENVDLEHARAQR